MGDIAPDADGVTTDDQAPEGGAPTGGDDKGKAPTGGEGKTFTQAEVDAMLAPLQAAATELTQIKDSEKTELQREREAREAAESRAEAAELDRMREKIANRPGKVVPVASLTAKTEAELLAQADTLLSWRDENAPKQEPKERKRNPAGGGGGFKSGATGADSGSTDPKVLAAEALRRLRNGE